MTSWIDVGHANGLFQSPDGTGAALNGMVRGSAAIDGYYVNFYGNVNYSEEYIVHQIKITTAPVSGYDRSLQSAYFKWHRENTCLNSTNYYDYPSSSREPGTDDEILLIFDPPLNTANLPLCPYEESGLDMTEVPANASAAVHAWIIQDGYMEWADSHRWTIVSIEAIVEATESPFWTGNVGTLEVAI